MLQKSRQDVAGVAILLIFVVCGLQLLFLQSVSNSPIGFFPDEIGKINQILGNQRNFRHPELLVEAIRLANVLAGDGSVETAFRIGRAISNLLAAMTTFILGYALLRFSRECPEIVIT